MPPITANRFRTFNGFVFKGRTLVGVTSCDKVRLASSGAFIFYTICSRGVSLYTTLRPNHRLRITVPVRVLLRNIPTRTAPPVHGLWLSNTIRTGTVCYVTHIHTRTRTCTLDLRDKLRVSNFGFRGRRLKIRDVASLPAVASAAAIVGARLQRAPRTHVARLVLPDTFRSPQTAPRSVND